MIIRIVKLTFQPDRVDDFTGIFNKEKSTILSFEGCMRVELWQDIEHDNVFFTYSEWRDKQALENYRNSEFFRQTWARAKALFSDKPYAWSLAVADA